MEDLMSFSDNIDPEIKNRAKICLSRIKNGTYKKRTLPNTSNNFDLERAHKEFIGLAESDYMKQKIKNT